MYPPPVSNMILYLYHIFLSANFNADDIPLFLQIQKTGFLSKVFNSITSDDIHFSASSKYFSDNFWYHPTEINGSDTSSRLANTHIKIIQGYHLSERGIISLRS